MDRLSESELQAMLNKPVSLPEPLRASVLWIDEQYNLGDWEVPIPESDRTRLLEGFISSLKRPFGSASVVPTTLTPGDGGALDVLKLRSVAAQFQSDVLIVLSTRANAYSDWNPLAISYVVLVPALFVPGDNLAVYTSAEACAVDVRTGVFLACVQGHGDAARSLVTVPGRKHRFRELATEAAEAAFKRLPLDLTNAVRVRTHTTEEPNEVSP